jgi:hypothetical protein
VPQEAYRGVGLLACPRPEAQRVSARAPRSWRRAIADNRKNLTAREQKNLRERSSV